jgi:hypothetical protein
MSKKFRNKIISCRKAAQYAIWSILLFANEAGKDWATLTWIKVNLFIKQREIVFMQSKNIPVQA